MKKWFRGKRHPEDWVDFQTSTTLYEVKSCCLILEHDNGKGVVSHKLGRFHVQKDNHKLLKKYAMLEEKKAKYIFVVVVGKQHVFRVYDWDTVDFLRKRDKDKDTFRIKIGDVFRRD